MAKIRRVVRKVQPPGGAYFDEQLWPINIALVVLGCFLIGISLAYQPLWGPPWYATAWPSLVGVPLFIAACLALFRYIDNRFLRRSLQLSIVLCAIAHIALIIHLIETRMLSSLAIGESSKTKLVERPPPKIIPEYHPTQLIPEEDRPRQDFEKPVETQTPEPTRQPEQIVRQPTPEERSPAEPQPVPVPEQQRTIEPNVVNRETPNEVAPRLAAQPSQLSRQVKPSEDRTSQLADLPQPVPRPAASVEARPTASAAVQQQSDSAKVARAAKEPTATTESPSAQLARSTSERAPTANAPAGAAIPRATSQSASPDASVAAVDAPSSPTQTQATEIAPASSTPARESTLTSQVARRSAEPLAAATNQPTSQPQRREASRADQPTVAAANANIRRSPAADRASVATAAAAPEPTASPAASNTSVAEVTPRASTVERAAAEVTSGQPARSSASEPRSPSLVQPATSIARTQSRDNPVATLQPQSNPGNTPRRAVNVAAAANSPTAVDSPATAVSTANPAEPSAQPARLALSKGQSGIAGSGRSANIDSSVPGNVSPALVASGAARRAEATQQNPQGDALAPSSPAQLARSRAGASLPTAALKAEPVPMATAAGGSQLAEVTASSSAALTQSNAAASKDAVTAAKGIGEVDLGPTQMVAEAGIGRAAGGGQPQLSFQPPAPQVARTTSAGGAPLMALAPAEVGDLTAPLGRTGGTPRDATPSPTNLAIGRSSTADSADLRPSNAAPVESSANSRPNGGDSAERIARAVASGEPSAVDDEEETRRLARASAGGLPTSSATSAEPVAAPSAPAGAADVAAIDARSLEPSRTSGGPAATARAESRGTTTSRGIAEPGQVILSSATPSRRSASTAGESAPAIGDIASAAGATSRAPATAIAGGSTTIADIPDVGPRSAVAQAELDHQLSGAGQTLAKSQSSDALAVDIAAPAGPGGLGSDYSPDVGINTRQARIDSLNVQLRTARFLRSQVGGLPAVSTAAIVATDAFSSRGARVRGDLPAGGHGTPAPQTEEAIERGLAFLARHQAPDGGWSLQGFPEEAQLASDTAATALAVIAFQGAGYNHREFQYKDVVRGGIDYLVKSQKENGDLFVPLDDASNRSVWLYSHSLAAIALCEAYGMTQDPALRVPAQRALDFVVASQHRERGGWRYAPGVSSDTSVTGWMMMALKSGELAKLRVPKTTTAQIARWLDDAQQSPEEPHLYRYNPYAPDTLEQRHGRTASKTMTAVGLLMRLYSGWERDHQGMIRGAQFLAENLPADGTAAGPQRDTYYWYYATQVMAHVGGSYWQAWNDKLHPLLVNSQVPHGPMAGSWDPQGPIPDRWGPHAGRLYVTAMNLLSLEVQYRKLPLYEDTVKP